MINVSDGLSFSGPPGKFRATIIKHEKGLLSKSTYVILQSLLIAQRQRQATQKHEKIFFLENRLLLASRWFDNQLYKITLVDLFKMHV